MKENLKITEAYFALARSLASVVPFRSKNKFVINIAGESGSGKSVTGTCLKEVLEESGKQVAYLQMDDYFHLPPEDNHQNRLKSLCSIGPDEVNLTLLDQHIISFKKNINTTGPESNFSLNKFLEKDLLFEDIDVLIVEGTYTPLLRETDFLIFIDINYKETHLNRINRGRDKNDPFIERVLGLEHEIIKKYKAKADIIIDKTYKISEHLV